MLCLFERCIYIIFVRYFATQSGSGTPACSLYHPEVLSAWIKLRLNKWAILQMMPVLWTKASHISDCSSELNQANALNKACSFTLHGFSTSFSTHTLMSEAAAIIFQTNRQQMWFCCGTSCTLTLGQNSKNHTRLFSDEAQMRLKMNY